MQWDNFVNKVQNELSAGNNFFDFDVPFEEEHQLTRATALGLRKLFAYSYNIANSTELHYHVVYRKGDTDQDRQAWNSVRSNKWILIHGVRFVPDILIRRSLIPQRISCPSKLNTSKRPKLPKLLPQPSVNLLFTA